MYASGSALFAYKTKTILSERNTILFEPVYEISYNVVCVTSKGSDQPAHTCSLIRAFACCLNFL